MSSSSVHQERKKSSKVINKKRKLSEVVPEEVQEHEDENDSNLSNVGDNITTGVTNGAIQGRKKYNVINEDVRKKIIARLTDEEGTNIKEVASEFGLKLSTCKAILQVYQKEGRIGKKATRDRKSKIVSTILIVRIDPINPSSSTITPYVHVSEAMTSSNKKTDEEGSFQQNDLIKEAFKSAQEHIKTVIQENAQDIFLGGGGRSNSNNNPPVPASSQQDLEMAFMEAQRDAIKVILKENPVVQAGRWEQPNIEDQQQQQQQQKQTASHLPMMMNIRSQILEEQQVTDNQISNGNSRLYSNAISSKTNNNNNNNINNNNATSPPPVIHEQFTSQNNGNNFNRTCCCGGNHSDNFSSCMNCNNYNNNIKQQIIPNNQPPSTCSTTSSSSSSSSQSCFMSGTQLLNGNTTNNNNNIVISQHQSHHHLNPDQAFQQLHPQQHQPYIDHRTTGGQQGQHQQQQQSSNYDPRMSQYSITQTNNHNHNQTNQEFQVSTPNFSQISATHSEQPKKAHKEKGIHSNPIIKRRTNNTHKNNTGKNNTHHQPSQISPFTNTLTNLQSQQHQPQPQRQPPMNGSITFNTATTSQSQDCTLSSLYSPNQCAFIQQYSDSPSISTMNASSPAVTPFLNPFTLGSQSPVLLTTQNNNNNNNNFTNNFQSSLISPLNIAQNSPFAPTKSSQQFSLNQISLQEDSIKGNSSCQNEQSLAQAPESIRDTSLSQQQQYSCFY